MSICNKEDRKHCISYAAASVSPNVRQDRYRPSPSASVSGGDFEIKSHSFDQNPVVNSLSNLPSTNCDGTLYALVIFIHFIRP